MSFVEGSHTEDKGQLPPVFADAPFFYANTMRLVSNYCLTPYSISPALLVLNSVLIKGLFMNVIRLKMCLYLLLLF